MRVAVVQRLIFVGARDHSALALLMARVGANHHDTTVTTDDAAMLADPLHTWLNLHGCPLLVAVRNTATSQVVRTHLEDDAILWEDADIVLAHLAGNRRQNDVLILQLDAEHCIWQRLNNLAFDFDHTIFCHRTSIVAVITGVSIVRTHLCSKIAPPV